MSTSHYDFGCLDWHADQAASTTQAAAEILDELIAGHVVLQRGREPVSLAQDMAGYTRDTFSDAQMGKVIAAWSATKAPRCTENQRLLAASVILGVLDDVMREVIDARAAEEADDRERARVTAAEEDAAADSEAFA